MNTSLQSYIIKQYFVDVLANALLLQNYGDFSVALFNELCAHDAQFTAIFNQILGPFKGRS